MTQSRWSAALVCAMLCCAGTAFGADTQYVQPPTPTAPTFSEPTTNATSSSYQGGTSSESGTTAVRSYAGSSTTTYKGGVASDGVATGSLGTTTLSYSGGSASGSVATGVVDSRATSAPQPGVWGALQSAVAGAGALFDSATGRAPQPSGGTTTFPVSTSSTNR